MLKMEAPVIYCSINVNPFIKVYNLDIILFKE